jgi:hypothetical protein
MTKTNLRVISCSSLRRIASSSRAAGPSHATPLFKLRREHSSSTGPGQNNPKPSQASKSCNLLISFQVKVDRKTSLRLTAGGFRIVTSLAGKILPEADIFRFHLNPKIPTKLQEKASASSLKHVLITLNCPKPQTSPTNKCRFKEQARTFREPNHFTDSFSDLRQFPAPAHDNSTPHSLLARK